MAGLQDMLGGLLGILGGGQGGITQMQMQPPQQQQNNQYAGLLNDPQLQQLINGQKQNAFYSGLLKAGQPSPYKTNFMQALGQGQMASDQAGNGFNDALINARVKQMTPQWKETKDAFGNPLVYNETDPSQTKSLTPGSTPNNPAGSGMFTDNELQGYLDGRMSMSPRMASTPRGQALIQALYNKDPSFDTVNYNKRNQTAKSFAPGGKDRNNINSIETALNTLSLLNDSNDKVGGVEGYGVLNSPINTMRTGALSMSNDTDLARYNKLAKDAADEVTKAIVATGGTGGDRETRFKGFDPHQSQSARKSVIQASVDELMQRMNPVADSYNNGMGQTKQGIHLLTPQAQTAYAKVMGTAPALTSATGNMNQDVSTINNQGGNAPPAAAIQMLRSNPSLAPAFEAKYGIPSGSFLTNGGASGGF